MSSSRDSTIDRAGLESGSRGKSTGCGFGFGRHGARGNWCTSNIAVMVLGFVFFWPVGLLILYWIGTGRHVRDLPGAVRELWTRTFGENRLSRSSASDNSVFNAYQQTQFDRIAEIRDEIKSRSDRFRDFRADAKRRADEEEFNRFMNDVPGNGNV